MRAEVFREQGCLSGGLVRRSELGVVCVGIWIIGPAKPEIHSVIFDIVPTDADRNGWFLDSKPEATSRMMLKL